MKTLAAVDLLEGWDRGRAASDVTGSALALLRVAHPGSSWETLAELSIGRRDGLLLELRQQVFGQALRGLVNCPQCDETLEADFGLADILIRDGLENAATTDQLALQSGGYEITFRLPNSYDLMALRAANDVAEGQRVLFERTLVTATSSGQSIEMQTLPTEILQLAEQQMAKSDPQADVTLNLTCSRCSSRFDTCFDIASFLWKEVDAWAICRLREVHILASAYGWREADILAMSPWRRSCYMEMVS